MALLAASGLAFTLTAWMLVHFDNPLGSMGSAGTPTSVVQAHLEALNRGDLHAAYDLFSQRYRQQVSFEAYHQLVSKHWRLFNIREFRVSRDDEWGGRAALETSILSVDGRRYLARFTLVHAEGRWWIDDLRWGGMTSNRGVTAA